MLGGPWQPQGFENPYKNINFLFDGPGKWQ
jgi:hypothetical protein